MQLQHVKRMRNIREKGKGIFAYKRKFSCSEEKEKVLYLKIRKQFQAE